MTEAPWLDLARERLGVQEMPGPDSDPTVMGWFKSVGHAEVTADETSWCAVFAGATLKDAGLPIPPTNVNMLARSYLTYGVKCEPKPGAIAIWPRGKAWQGHVNFVESVTDDGKVVCIGGNQSMRGGDAVTRTKPQSPEGALDFRWPVAPTVPELRKAGSTEIQKGDAIQKAGISATFLGPIIAAIKELLAPITAVPVHANINESLSWWQTVIGGANAVSRLVMDNPWLAGTVFLGLTGAWVGHTIKAARVAKAQAGVPLSAEMAGMGVA